MPTYEYKCSNCDYKFEEFQSITAKPLKKCPQCGKNTLKRLIGVGAGLIFKGSGFYQTDYRSENYKKAASAEKKSASSVSSGSSAGTGTSGTAASSGTSSNSTSSSASGSSSASSSKANVGSSASN